MSTTANAIAGTCYVTAGGVTYDIAGEGTYQCSGVSREALHGQNGFQGFSEKRKGGMMKWQGRNSSAVSIAALNDLVNASVVFELVNGKVIVGQGMFRNGDPIEVNTEEGTFDVEMFGPTVTEN